MLIDVINAGAFKKLCLILLNHNDLRYPRAKSDELNADDAD